VAAFETISTHINALLLAAADGRSSNVVAMRGREPHPAR
jgi:hypothetical protein